MVISVTIVSLVTFNFNNNIFIYTFATVMKSHCYNIGKWHNNYINIWNVLNQHWVMVISVTIVTLVTTWTAGSVINSTVNGD